jgi:nucleoside phosphorylase
MSSTDIAIYAALTEEFQYVIATIPFKATVTEALDMGLFYHFYEIPSLDHSQTYHVLLVKAGAMGPPRAAAITAHIHATFHPRDIVVLGISGSLDKDLLLGDVFAPKIVDNYLSVSAAVTDPTANTWKLSSSGGGYRPDGRIANRLRSISHNHPNEWAIWQDQCTGNATLTLPSELYDETIRNNLMHPKGCLLAEELNLASGELLGKSDLFVSWLREHDRKFAAIDMESCGAFEISDIAGSTGPRVLALRGISDFADKRKADIENKYGKSMRKIATENATNFLLTAIQLKVFDNEHYSPTAISDVKIEPTPFFHDYLNSTEVTFQHRFKPTIELKDLFVYPDLQKFTEGDSSGNLVKINASSLKPPSVIEEAILLLGDSQVGKTALLKTLFVEYLNQKAIPILIDCTRFRNADFPKTLNNETDRQYGLLLQQLIGSGRQIVLLLDNFHAIPLNRRNQEALLSYLHTISRSIIVSSTSDIIAINTRFASFSHFTRYRIMPFGNLRRAELITLWIKLGQEDLIQDSDYLRRLDILTRHIDSVIMKNILPPKPFYICSILQVFEASSPSDFHITSYGHCYQSLIVRSFSAAGVPASEMGRLVNYLTEIAYFAFLAAKPSLSPEDFDVFAKQYSDKYLIPSHRDVVNSLIKCNLLQHDEFNQLEFSYKYVYYFYCAKYLSDNFNAEEIQTLIANMCKRIYLDENANIIIFMTYHSRDQRLIDEILLHTMCRYGTVKESTLEAIETKHFVEYEALIPQLVMEERDVLEQRKRALEARDTFEATPNPDIPEIENEPALVEYQEFHSSLRSIQILGQILRNQHASFKKEQLFDLGEVGINVGLRVLRKYLDITSDRKEAIKELISQVMSEKSTASNDEISKEVSKLYSSICYWLVYLIIEYIAVCMAAEETMPILTRILNNNSNSPAHHLIWIAESLHANQQIPRTQIDHFYNKVSNDLLSKRLLRQVVLRYCYLHEIDFKDKQWLSSKIHLPIRDQVLAKG